MFGGRASRAARKQSTSLSHMIVSKRLDFTLTYFLCILHSLTAGWCAIFTHTQHPSWIIGRNFCSGFWCVLNSQYHPASHTLIFLQCTKNVIDLERKTEELMARMFVHILTFEIVLVTPSGALSSSNKQAALWPEQKYTVVRQQTVITSKREYTIGTYYRQNTYH